MIDLWNEGIGRMFRQRDHRRGEEHKMSTLNKTLKLIVPMLLGGLGTAVVVTAGPLDPPSGVIAPSYKTLSEVEPRMALSTQNTPGDSDSVLKITQSGSYYLTGNVSGVSGKHSIEIASNNVTIDLNGFALTGGAGTKDGISATGLTGVRIRNGFIRGHATSGIYLGNCQSTTLENLTVTGNVLDGVWPGSSATVARVKASGNGRHGFQLTSTSTSTLSECTAESNTGIGFFAPSGEVNFIDCIARLNGGNGIEVSAGNRVTRCTSAGNTGSGFRTIADRAVFEGCSAEANTGAGFELNGYDHIVRNSSSRSNGRGATAFSGFASLTASNHMYEGCTSLFNGKAGFESATTRTDYVRCISMENNADGITAPTVTIRVIDCRIEANSARGIDAGAATVIERTVVRGCPQDAIRIGGNGNATIRFTQVTSGAAGGAIVGNGSVVEDCTFGSIQGVALNAGALSSVRRCTFDANGSAAGLQPQIQCTGGGNLIEDNYIFGGDAGIQITSAGGSIVRRNIVNGTANNYGLIVPGNRLATINTSATLTSGNPNENFGY